MFKNFFPSKILSLNNKLINTLLIVMVLVVLDISQKKKALFLGPSFKQNVLNLEIKR